MPGLALSQVTSLQYKDHVVNVVDTPGHADFGSEVSFSVPAWGCLLFAGASCSGPLGHPH
jgi:GTP-binding protein